MKTSTKGTTFRKSLFPFFVIVILSAVIFSLLYPGEADSGQATLSWSPPTTYTDGTPLTNLGGFKLYYGTASGSYSQVLNVGNVTTYTASNLTDGLTYYFAATAYDSSGVESVYSGEVSRTIPTPVQQYGLTISKGGTGSGTVSSSPAGISCGISCAASYNAGTIVTLTAAPASGSTFSGWSGGGCVGNGTCSITMNASAAVTASFVLNPTTYTITATAGTGGSITPSGTVTVSQGGSQTFSITPNGGYSIASVTVDGVSVGAVASYTFTNVTANHTISATFAANPTTYTITATAGAGGSISPSGAVSVNQGASQTFSITPNTGYSIASVTVDGASVGAVASYTFSSITANHSISVTFFASNAITEEWGNAPTSNHLGTIEDTYINIDSTNYATGSQLVTYTWPAGSVANAIVIKWDVSSIPPGSSIVSATLSLYMEGYEGTGGNALYNVTAHKVINKNPVISQATGYNASASNAWSPATGVYNNIPLAQGDISQPEDARAIDMTLGYKSWTVTTMVQDWVNNSNTNYGMLLNSDASAISDSNRHFSSSENLNAAQRPKLVITYIPPSLLTYTITATAGTGGSISPSGAVSVNQGGSQTFSITANAGYSIASVTVDGASVSVVSTYIFTNVTAKHTIAAAFTANPVNGVCGSSNGGTFTTAPATNLCSVGTATAVSGNGPWTWNCAGANGGTTASCSANIQTWTVTPSAGANGSISPSGAVSVNQGGSQTFSITANAGYSIASVTVDGVSVGAVASYTFTNVTANHTISASFAANTTTYTITATAGWGGSISPSGSITVSQGGSQAFTITPKYRYKVADVKVDGVSVGATTSYTFLNDTANHNITASFIRK